MATPTNLKGESLSKLLQGSAIGAVVAVTLGFSVGGWTLGSSAEKQAMDHAKSTLVSTLAPICVDSFQSSPNLAKNLEELIKQSTYQRVGYMEKGGWTTFPGSDQAVSGVAKACAELLLES